MRRLALLVVLLLAGGGALLVLRPAPAPPRAPLTDDDPVLAAARSEEPATAESRPLPGRSLGGRPAFVPGPSPSPGAAGGAPSVQDPAAAPGTATGAVAGAPPHLEIIDPPEDARELSDRSAHIAAEAYRNVVRALRLDADQEERLKQLLYDTRGSYEAQLALVRRALDERHLEGRERALAEEEARKKAFDEQKPASEDALRDLLGEAQMKTWSAMVQNPLFLANALRFKVNPVAGAAAP